nr:hypothetical protein [Nostoc sp. PCC 7120 = FACHB-418]
MFILTWHIWDKMSGHWTYLTPISIVIIAGITVLFMLRMWMEHQVKRKKFDAKINPERLPR